MKQSVQILGDAIGTQEQRATEHGYDAADGERTAPHIRRIFNAITGRNITEREVWIFLLALKLARNEAKPGTYDTLVDMVSYASLLGECDYLERAEADEKERAEDMIKQAEAEALRYGLAQTECFNTDRAQLMELAKNGHSREAVAAYATEQKTPAPEWSPWIDWHGGEFPLKDDSVYQIRYRDETANPETSRPSRGATRRWYHIGTGGDIVAYRYMLPEWIEWSGATAWPVGVDIEDFIDVKLRSGKVVTEKVKHLNFRRHDAGQQRFDVMYWRKAQI